MSTNIMFYPQNLLNKCFTIIIDNKCITVIIPFGQQKIEF